MPARLKNTLIHTESCAIWSAFDQESKEIPYVLRAGRHVDSSREISDGFLDSRLKDSLKMKL
ncbi:MAG TPA: hypothetical protein PK590_05715 [Candidatus Omnitrophota bacterium]|nr:hypothetical protein [Candidatus Omnitrophota bacterium]